MRVRFLQLPLSAWSGKSSRGVVWHWRVVARPTPGAAWHGSLEAVRLVEGPVSKAGKGLMKASAGSIPVASSKDLGVVIEAGMGRKATSRCPHCRICITPQVLYCYDCLQMYRIPAHWQVTQYFCLPDSCEPIYAA